MNTRGITGHTAQLRRLSILRERGTLPGTLIFTGMPGIGKKTVAQRLLASLFCPALDPPCLQCASCRQAGAGSHPDIIELLPDEKGKIPIGSQERDEPGTVRWLIERLSKRSISGSYGVIIDGIEHISPGGQNALLKTIEEPQEGTTIILISSNRSQVLSTILSRSAEIPFLPLSDGQVGQVLRGLSPGDATGPAALISGGSVERAMALSDATFLESLLGLCAGISGTANSGAPFDVDLSQFQKRPGYETLLDMLVQIYRSILRGMLQGTGLPEALAPAAIADRDTIVKLIKIFLALKGGLANNLNMKMHMKGMLYAIGGMDATGMPDLTA